MEDEGWRMKDEIRAIGVVLEMVQYMMLVNARVGLCVHDMMQADDQFTLHM